MDTVYFSWIYDSGDADGDDDEEPGDKSRRYMVDGAFLSLPLIHFHPYLGHFFASTTPTYILILSWLVITIVVAVGLFMFQHILR